MYARGPQEVTFLGILFILNIYKAADGKFIYALKKEKHLKDVLFASYTV